VRLGSLVGQYVVAAAVFTVVDLTWIVLVASPAYDAQLGDLLAEQPNALAAVAFYLIFVAGLLGLVIRPALAERSPRRALLAGAAFGLVAYATWALTGLAVLSGFPLGLALLDMAWGAVLAAVVSTATYAIWVRLESRRQVTRGRAGQQDAPQP
jgi:uncharacterized membrane protein